MNGDCVLLQALACGSAIEIIACAASGTLSNRIAVAGIHSA
jgi:hypothetical protein